MNQNQSLSLSVCNKHDLLITRNNHLLAYIGKFGEPFASEDQLHEVVWVANCNPRFIESSNTTLRADDGNTLACPKVDSAWQIVDIVSINDLDSDWVNQYKGQQGLQVDTILAGTPVTQDVEYTPVDSVVEDDELNELVCFQFDEELVKFEALWHTIPAKECNWRKLREDSPEDFMNMFASSFAIEALLKKGGSEDIDALQVIADEHGINLATIVTINRLTKDLMWGSSNGFIEPAKQLGSIYRKAVLKEV